MKVQMVKMQIVLMSCITLLLAGCVETNEHGIFRSDDMVTVYWVLQEDTKIADFKLTDNVLELEIDMGKQRETQNLPIKTLEKDEALEIKGMSTLNDLAIFHIVVNPLLQSHPELPRTRSNYTTYQRSEWYRDDRVGDLTKAEFFRSGDRITAYWRISEKTEKKEYVWYKWASGYKTSDKWMESRELPDDWVEVLPLPAMEPQEQITCIGVGKTPELFITYFRVSSNPTH